MYQNQYAALMAAAKIVEELSDVVDFGVTVTSVEDDAELNIYVSTREKVRALTKRLHLGLAQEISENSATYQIGPLTVSVIVSEEEENNE